MFFYFKSSSMSYSVLSASFEYLCYGSTAIVNVYNAFSEGIVFRLQNLTSMSDSKDSPSH